MSKRNNKIMAWMARKMISCEEAAYLISLKQDQRLTMKQRVQLRMHVLSCRFCKRYERQVHILSMGIKKIKESIDAGKKYFRLSTEQKTKMQKRLDEE